ncbi:TetR/AcrR family transcriptional regulator C-terminal domain-containing protein [Nonomuraea sp. M3C6]|uniref:TetR/AcrR family transcriptional regulator C-terminal domain-containing protein n=1 Tax=Nonomuraea marmarensis TaxID=3351344 RepID=A0ABW7A569_9ACTN
MSKPFASVWLREPRKATSPGRSREEIVNAAVELLDEEGLNGLSMRKLGAKLSAGATSLYWYVANKDELLELAYDEVWGEMTISEPEVVGWRDAASTQAYSMRQAMLRHPWSADLLGRMPALGPNAIQVADRMRRMFKLAGFDGMDIDYAVGTLTAYVYGMTVPEIVWNAALSEHEYDPDEMRKLVATAVRDFPGMLERMNTDIYQDPQAVRAVAFDFGLVSVLDGLERRLVT